MKQDEINVEEALSGLREIQRTLERVQGAKRFSHPRSSVTVYLAIQAVAALCAAALLGSDLFNSEQTGALLLSVNNRSLQLGGLWTMGAMVIALLACSYFLVWSAAAREGETASDYLSRNFAYVSNLSFLSDLMVKFLVLCALVLAEKPQWFGPALIIFTGDYIFQGRFFSLPFTAGTILGAACFVAGLAQILIGSPSVAPALAIFVAVTCYSLFHTIKLLTSESQTGKDVQ